MKISAITPYLFYPGKAKNLFLCRVDTDEGLYGWGEAYVARGRELPVREYVRSISPLLIDQSPFQIKPNGDALFQSFLSRRGSPDFFSAWSAIELALWDIVGKFAGLPVCDLLGGRSRTRIRVYANGWWQGAKTPDEAATGACKAIELGFTALKCSPLPRPWRAQLSRQEEDAAVAIVAAVRQAIGPDVELMVDALRHLTPYHVRSFFERIAPYDIAWLEEPCPVESPYLLEQAKPGISVPFVAGETLCTKEEFHHLLERRVVEIINPDVCACGGILRTLEIASMAEAYHVMISPHNYNSIGVGLAATCQVAAVASLCEITEVFVDFPEFCQEVFPRAPRMREGFVEISDEPGLGIDVDLQALQRHPPLGI